MNWIIVDYENYYPKNKKGIPKANEQKSGSKGTSFTGNLLNFDFGKIIPIAAIIYNFGIRETIFFLFSYNAEISESWQQIDSFCWKCMWISIIFSYVHDITI